MVSFLSGCFNSTEFISYERHRDFEHPDHAQPLLAQRQKAREQQLLTFFLSLCPQAPEYYQQLEQRRLNARHHVQKILALVEIYGAEKVIRALHRRGLALFSEVAAAAEFTEFPTVGLITRRTATARVKLASFCEFEAGPFAPPQIELQFAQTTNPIVCVGRGRSVFASLLCLGAMPFRNSV